MGGADILVCEAFVGNVILKFFEGVALTFLGCIKEGLMSSLRTKLGALMVKPALKGLVKTFDVSSQGGAPLLGLKGLVVKAHGKLQGQRNQNRFVPVHSIQRKQY